MPKKPITKFFSTDVGVIPTKIAKPATIISSSAAGSPVINSQLAIAVMLDNVPHSEQQRTILITEFYEKNDTVGKRVVNRLIRDGILPNNESYHLQAHQLLDGAPAEAIPGILRANNIRLSNDQIFNLRLGMSITDYLLEGGQLIRTGGYSVGQLIDMLIVRKMDLFDLPSYDDHARSYRSRLKAAFDPEEIELEDCPDCKQKTLKTILKTTRSWDEAQEAISRCTNRLCKTYRA